MEAMFTVPIISIHIYRMRRGNSPRDPRSVLFDPSLGPVVRPVRRELQEKEEARHGPSCASAFRIRPGSSHLANRSVKWHPLRLSNHEMNSHRKILGQACSCVCIHLGISKASQPYRQTTNRFQDPGPSTNQVRAVALQPWAMGEST